MRGIVIKDLHKDQNFLAVDLRDVLGILGRRAKNSRWTASEVWATGENSTGEVFEFEKIADRKTLIPGEELVRIANEVVHQVIDGEFRGFDENSTAPWVVIRAVDSSFYEVFSPELEILESVRRSFRDVSECEQDL